MLKQEEYAKRSLGRKRKQLLKKMKALTMSIVSAFIFLKTYEYLKIKSQPSASCRQLQPYRCP